MEEASAAAYQKARFTKRMAKQIKKEIQYRRHLLREEKKNQKPPESRNKRTSKIAINQGVKDTKPIAKGNIHTTKHNSHTPVDVAKSLHKKQQTDSQPNSTNATANETTELIEVRYRPDASKHNSSKHIENSQNLKVRQKATTSGSPGSSFFPLDPITLRLFHYNKNHIHILADENNAVFYGDADLVPSYRIDQYQDILSHAATGFSQEQPELLFENGYPRSQDGARFIIHMKDACLGVNGRYTNVFRGVLAFQARNGRRPGDLPEHRIGQQPQPTPEPHSEATDMPSNQPTILAIPPVDSPNTDAPTTNCPETTDNGNASPELPSEPTELDTSALPPDSSTTPPSEPTSEPPNSDLKPNTKKRKTSDTARFVSGKGSRHHCLMTGAIDPRNPEDVQALIERLRAEEEARLAFEAESKKLDQYTNTDQPASKEPTSCEPSQNDSEPPSVNQPDYQPTSDDTNQVIINSSADVPTYDSDSLPKVAQDKMTSNEGTTKKTENHKSKSHQSQSNTSDNSNSDGSDNSSQRNTKLQQDHSNIPKKRKPKKRKPKKQGHPEKPHYDSFVHFSEINHPGKLDIFRNIFETEKDLKAQFDIDPFDLSFLHPKQEQPSNSPVQPQTKPANDTEIRKLKKVPISIKVLIAISLLLLLILIFGENFVTRVEGVVGMDIGWLINYLLAGK